MSSVSRINGFRPVKTATGPYTGQANLYFLDSGDSTVVMVGDAVKLAGNARAASGVPTVTRCGATDIPIGIVVGILFTGVGDVTNVLSSSRCRLPEWLPISDSESLSNTSSAYHTRDT